MSKKQFKLFIICRCFSSAEKAEKLSDVLKAKIDDWENSQRRLGQPVYIEEIIWNCTVGHIIECEFCGCSVAAAACASVLYTTQPKETS